MLIVPIQPVPSQSLSVTLGNQQCQLSIYQKSTGLFFDLGLGSSPVISGVICLNLVKLVRTLYLGFIGDFVFVDTQGDNDPSYLGLGTRYLLAYLEAFDLPSIELINTTEETALAPPIFSDFNSGFSLGFF